MTNLAGKTALVTGAARGLGRAYALRLAKLGANVGIVDLDLRSYNQFEGEKRLLTADTSVEECEALGVKAHGVQADASKREEINQAVAEIEAKLGPIDILVNNAGGGMGPLAGNKPTSLDWEHFHTVTERNYFATVYTCNAVVPGMKERRYGKVINVVSIYALAASSDGSYSHYGAAKAAIRHYTKFLSQEVGRYNVTANCIAPGFILTGRLTEIFKKAGEASILRNIAMKRFGTVDDCANVVEFLASDLSDYVTGCVIDVTGGASARFLMNEPSEY